MRRAFGDAPVFKLSPTFLDLQITALELILRKHSVQNVATSDLITLCDLDYGFYGSTHIYMRRTVEQPREVFGDCKKEFATYYCLC